MENILSKYIVKKSQLNQDNNNGFDSFDSNNNEFSKNSLIKTRSIKEYYDNANVFVTGKWIRDMNWW